MKIETPTNCPSCNSLLSRVKDQLFCNNSECGDVLHKKVVNFTKVLKIKGLGEKTIEKLNIVTINDIYSLTYEDAMSVIGEKLATKLITEINNKKVVDLSLFLAACSIPLIGMTAARKISTVVTTPKEINQKKCKDAGLGEKATLNLIEWVRNSYPSLEILPIQFKYQEQLINQLDDNCIKVCITGRIKGYTKATLTKYLAEISVDVCSTINKNTNYVLCEERKGSAKENKANELGIKIITLNELKEIIKNDNKESNTT